MMKQPESVAVLLYDGECGLCNWFVRLLLRTDKAGRLHYAPLQSAPAQDYLRQQGWPTDDFDSLIFVPDWEHRTGGAALRRTDGALAAANVIGGVWRFVVWMRILPAGLRDVFYQLVARSRYTIFGQYRPTPLPNPAWAKRFLAGHEGSSFATASNDSGK